MVLNVQKHLNSINIKSLYLYFQNYTNRENRRNKTMEGTICNCALEYVEASEFEIKIKSRTQETCTRIVHRDNNYYEYSRTEKYTLCMMAAGLR